MKKTYNDYAGKLILCSSGAFTEHEKTDADNLQNEMLKTCSNDRSVLVVLNASDTGSNPLGKAHTAEIFRSLGAKLVDEKSLSTDNFVLLKNYDVIYFMGGDCAPLIKLANTNGFKDEIVNCLKLGKIIIGQSAGTLMFQKTLKYYYLAKKGTKAKYDIPLETYDGLNMVDELFYPHFNRLSPEFKAVAEKVEKENGIKFTKMTDGKFFIYDLKNLKY